jgi:cytoplasmic iron level regulating protein YaaA (DUF328/UPF0246 family)
VLILLPPSEGKSPASAGPPLRLDAMSYPSLTATRTLVLDALIRLCEGRTATATRVLDLGPTQHGDIALNAGLRHHPCAPAIEVYTGVLYESLDASSLTPAARARLDQHVAIASALWGLVPPSDLIPAYRLSGGATLPRVGGIATAWRPAIQEVLRATSGLVVDMRSSAYVALGPVPEERDGESVTVRVLTERNGRLITVSHHNKATKGLLVRSLATSRRVPSTIDELVSVLERAGHRLEVSSSARGRAPTLDVIIDS